MSTLPITFENAVKDVLNPDFHGALIDVNDTVDFAKKILLNNRVQNFTAADVVALTGIIIERQHVLHALRAGADE